MIGTRPIAAGVLIAGISNGLAGYRLRDTLRLLKLVKVLENFYLLVGD